MQLSEETIGYGPRERRLLAQKRMVLKKPISWTGSKKEGKRREIPVKQSTDSVPEGERA